MFKVKNGKDHSTKVVELPTMEALEVLPELEPTPVEVWKAGVVIVFPSGLKARVRPVTWEVLAENKDIPEELLNVVAEQLDGGDGIVKAPMKTLQDRLTYRKFLQNLAKRMFIEPKVASTPQDGELGVENIEDEDLYHLGMLIGAGTAFLRSFRPEQAETILSLARKHGIFPPAERDSEPASGSGQTDAGTRGLVDGESV